MHAVAHPKPTHRSTRSPAVRPPPRGGAPTSLARIARLAGLAALAALAALASCDGCQERAPNVCCTSDPECAELGLPPGSVSDYGCGQGHVCRDFYCVPAEGPDAGVLDAADAPSDAPSGRCDPDAPFGAPTRMANVNSADEDLSMAMTHDQLKAYFVRNTGTNYVIVSSKRDSPESDFPPPTTDPALAAVSAGAGYRSYVYPTSDDLVVYHRRDATWFASYRLDPDDPFDTGTEVLVGGAQIPAFRAIISANSQTIYYSSASVPLRAATKGSTHYAFNSDRAVTIFDLTDFAISADELTLYYSNYPNADVFRTTRSSRNVPFDVGVPLAKVNTTGPDIPLYVSPDDCFLYIRSNTAGSTQANDIWVARRGQ